MDALETEIFTELLVGDSEFHILGDTVGEGVVDVFVGFLVAVEEGWDDGDENDDKDGEEFDDEIAGFLEGGEEGFVAELLQGFVEGKDEGGEDGDRAEDAEDDAFGHNDTKIDAKGEGHETESDEAGDSGGGRTDDGAESFLDRLNHGIIGGFAFGLFFFKRMPEKDGIIHGDGELEDGSERFSDVGNLTEELVSAEIDENHDADANEKNEGGKPVVEQQEHDDDGKDDGDNNIDYLFALNELAKVEDESSHARDVGFFVDDVSDVFNCEDGFVGGGGGIEKDSDE